jgi:NADH:ubiquinone oxidoreductase subunit F (NADH-binding)/(2Fe-2S) ferredoxin/NAD-dependent dihydropyrimidine dehydrogenase PreA subunit
MKTFRAHWLICSGTGCQSAGSVAVRQALEAEIERRGLAEEVRVVETGCNGYCAAGPVMVAYPEGIFYQLLSAEDVPELVEEHLVKGRPVTRLLYREPEKKELIPEMLDIPFFAHQKLIVLRNKGLIDPEVIDEYIAREGYLGAGQALLEMAPADIVAEVKKSGLRGRGGGGFPTGLKWEFCAKTPGDVKYVLCNADEGDPGAFMDRSVLEADPHAVLEGMLIAAKAIGAHYGYIYCRAEYPLAVKRLNIAIGQARDYGLLGTDIMGSGFDFDLEVYQGAGAFVCGEETALMTSIEGRRGMAVNNIGLVEVPMGTPLRTIIYDIGGGIPGKKRKFKAVQLGGPSGGCIPEEYLDLPCDYEAITQAGAIMGSGGMIVMDDQTCMVDMARFFMDFVQDESCGKCTPCREGTRRMLQILERITSGQGRESDIALLEELAAVIKDAALCGLGQTGPNPILSTLRYFRDEYEAHILEKRCPAKRCPGLIRFVVDVDKCTSCGLCFRNCPVDAIVWAKAKKGEEKKPAWIDRDKCVKCLTCITSCKFDAID